LSQAGDVMLTSVFAPDVQAVLDQAKKSSGGLGTPFPSPAAPAPSPYPSPIDWRDQWIYFLMVDRFNNPLRGPSHPPFDGTFNGYQGGTYRGVREQLPYLKNLGVGAIWLSPVLDNLHFSFAQVYHGYGIHNFIRAERHFADNPDQADDELRALVDAAHALGIYVIFDIVLNHTGDVFAYDGLGAIAPHSDNQLPVHWRDETGTATFSSVEGIPSPPIQALVWPQELQKDDLFRRQGVTVGDDVIGDFSSLKQFRTDNPDVQRFLIRSYQYVIARFDCDGFRIDTLRYLLGDLPRLFGNSMREFALSIGKKNFFTFGEVFDQNSEADIARFIGRNTQDGSELVGVDAALDFPLFFSLKNVLKGFAPPQALVDMYVLRKQVEQNIVSSHGEATRFFVTFLDNHDSKRRFYSVDAADPTALDDQLTGAVACLYCLQGIPCLYYATEQQFHGGDGTNDELVREAFWGRTPNPPSPFDQTNSFYTAIRAVAQVRATQPALRYGRQFFRPISGDGATFSVSSFSPGVIAFSRILNDEEVVVLVNVADAAVDNLSVIVDSLLHPAGARFTVAFSNQSDPSEPDAVTELGLGRTLVIHEVDGSISRGPVHVLRLRLKAREAQILVKPL
jgi:glycosidase